MDPTTRRHLLQSYLRDVAPEGGFEAMIAEVGSDEGTEALESAGGLEGLEPYPPPTDAQTEAEHKARSKAKSGLQKLEGDRAQQLDDSEAEGLEALVVPQIRPVAFVRGGRYDDLAWPWKRLNEPEVKDDLAPLMSSIGRIDIPDSPLGYGGTGFVVGPDLVMTNRHVAQAFTIGLGTKQLRFTPGSALVGFLHEFEREEEDGATLDVCEVVMVHPYWDMALLRVDGLPASRPALSLDVRPPAELDQLDVIVVGYPALDPRNDIAAQEKLFKGTYYVKRIQPGRVRERWRVRSFGNEVHALTHDSSTLGGNSGSAVIDIETRRVVGLHFGGHYLKRNYAVPTWELARDRRVVSARVAFAGRVQPTENLERHWMGVDVNELPVFPPASPASAPAPAEQPPTGQTFTWTIPIQISVTVGAPTLDNVGHSAPRVTTSGVAPPPAPDDDTSSERPSTPTHDPTRLFPRRQHTMIERIYVVSDLHVGVDGDLNIFAGREAFPEFVGGLGSGDRLILNGDAFDFLLDDGPLDLGEAVPRARAIVEGGDGKAVFGALRAARQRGTEITIRIGNHDPETGLPEVRKIFDEAAGGVTFDAVEVSRFELGGVPVGIAHGEHVDHWNRFEHRLGKPDFSFPPGSKLVKSLLNRVKQDYRLRFADLLKPDVEGALLAVLAVEPKAARFLFSTDTLDIVGQLRKRISGRLYELPAPVVAHEAPHAADALDDEAADALEALLKGPSGGDGDIEEGLEAVFAPLTKKVRSAWLRAGLSLWARLQKHVAGDKGEAFFSLDPEPHERATAEEIQGGHDVDVVVLGHTHAARLQSFGGLTLANSGTWIPLMSLPSPDAPAEEWTDLLERLRDDRPLTGDAAHLLRRRFTAVELAQRDGGLDVTLLQCHPGPPTPLASVHVDGR